MNKIYYVIVSVFIPLLSFSQWQDFGVWTRINIEKKINPRSNLAFSEAFRFEENSTQLKSHFSQISYSFDLTKQLSIEPAYRAIQKFNFDETTDYKHRILINLNYKVKYKNLKFSVRERFQSELKNIQREVGWKNQKSYMRTRFQMEYDFNKRYTPFVSTELYFLLDGTTNLNKIRSKIGFQHELNKKNSLDFYYMIDQEINQNNPQRLFVIGIEYKFSF